MICDRGHEGRLCTVLCTWCPRLPEVYAAQAKETKRRGNLTQPEKCLRMKHEEDMRGVNGKISGSFATWFPRDPETGILLDPPKNAFTFDLSKDDWIINPWDIGFGSLECERNGDSIILSAKLIKYMKKINHPQADEAHRIIVQWKGYYGPEEKRTYAKWKDTGKSR